MTKIFCERCQTNKPKQEFSKGRGVCKKCRSRYVMMKNVAKAMEFAQRLINGGTIQPHEVEAAKTLYLSCKARIDACLHHPLYKGVNCEWQSPEQFGIDFINELPEQWGRWKAQQIIYDATGKGCDRPTIDRVKDGEGDNCIGYTLRNIQCLSHTENTQKAHNKPCMVLIARNGVKVSFSIYSSIKECVDKVNQLSGQNIPYNIMSRCIDDGHIHHIGDGWTIRKMSGFSKNKLLAFARLGSAFVSLCNKVKSPLSREKILGIVLRW